MITSHGRGGEQRHLLAVHRRLERGAQRHLGLPVAHVTAQQPVHGRRCFHVALDLGDRRRLIGRQLVLERRLEFLLPVGVGGEAVAAHGAPCGIQPQQLLGHVAHGLADARLGPLPARAAQPVERRPLAARVFLHEIELVHRHEQLVPAVIADLHQLVRGVADRHALQPDEDADAVIHVHDVMAHLQIAQVGQEGAGGRRAGGAARLGEQVRLGMDPQAGVR